MRLSAVSLKLCGPVKMPLTGRSAASGAPCSARSARLRLRLRPPGKHPRPHREWMVSAEWAEDGRDGVERLIQTADPGQRGGRGLACLRWE